MSSNNIITTTFAPVPEKWKLNNKCFIYFFLKEQYSSLNPLDKVKEESDNDNHDITEKIKIKSSVSTELDPLKWWWMWHMNLHWLDRGVLLKFE